MGRKITEDDYAKSLESRSISYVSGYKDQKTKCLHRCDIDGFEWEIRPNHIRQRKGCPKCSKYGLKITEKEYSASLENRTISYVSGYVNARIKCLHRCDIDGFEWQATPNRIKAGKGCPKCAKYGFDLSNDSNLYFLIAEEGYIKIGITKRCTKQRFSTFKREVPFDFNVYQTVELPGEKAWSEEKRLHTLLKQHNAGLKGFDGATEWFHANLEVMTEVNRTINEHSKELS